MRRSSGCRNPAPAGVGGLLLGCLLTGCASGGETGRSPAPTAAAAAPSPAHAAASVPQFRDAAEQLGIRFRYDHGGSGRFYYAEIAGGGGALFDYDGDGWLDVYLVQGAALPGYRPVAPLKNRLYRNLGAALGELPRFEDVTARAGVDGTRNGKKLYGIGCTVGDYDNDGHPDLFISGFEGAILYRSNGDGTFTDATRGAGIADTAFGASAAFVDYDRDGRLDLVACEYVRFRPGDAVRCADPENQADYCQPDYYPPVLSRLYRNLDGRRFRDVTDAAGLTRPGRALGVVAGDVNGDGWPDLFLTCDKTPNQLYINQRNGTFKEEAVSRGCALSLTGQAQSGMGVDMGDADGDLQPDLVATNYWMESNNLYRNLGDGNFMDVAASSGITGPNRSQVCFGAGLRDLNNDGWRDIFITNGHVLTRTAHSTPGADRAQTDQLFLNEGGGRFREVSAEAGAWFGQRHVGRGVAFGDLDNDGDLDLLLVPNEGPAAVVINDGGSRNHWLQLRLRGTRSNRDGIGAQVDVTVGGRVLRDEARSGYGYCSASDVRLHFGLGAHERAEKVEIRWPSGQVDSLAGLAAGAVYTITEGRGITPASPSRP